MSWTEGTRWIETCAKRPRPCRSKSKRILKKYVQKVLLSGRIKHKKDRLAVAAAMGSGKLGAWNDIEILWSTHPIPKDLFSDR